MQLLAALKDATERLTRSGVASPQVDAELLLAHVTGVSRGEVPPSGVLIFMILECYAEVWMGMV